MAGVSGEGGVRAIRILAGLTVKETLRKRLFLVSVLISLLFFLVSLMPTWFGATEIGIPKTDARRSVAVLVVVFMGVPMLKYFAALEVIGLASGAISGEIERGLLAAVLAKPVPRWQVVVGKWLGINLLMASNLLFWSALLWVSLRLQTGVSYPTLFAAGGVSILYAVVASTLTLFFSTFAAPALAGGLTLLLAGTAWPHAVFHQMGTHLEVPALVRAGEALRYLVPISQVGLWVERALGPLNPLVLIPRTDGDGPGFAIPLDATRGDLLYVGAYVACFFLGALLIFHRRDIS